MNKQKEAAACCGFLCINKEKGYTSFDVVARLRGILQTKKIGHMGTLDPDATGVLPAAVGRATKAMDFLPDHTKAYRAEMLLGKTTDTLDTSGTVISEKEVNVTEEQVRKAVLSFVGTYDQIPPMVSAKKVNGKRLYELARQGITVERKPVTVEISSLEIESVKLPRVTFSVTCSKGTYVRSLIDDIGRSLGCGACMSGLTRTRSGRFSLEQARSLDEIEAAKKDGRLDELLIPLCDALDAYPAATVKEKSEKKARNGGILSGFEFCETDTKGAELIRVFLPDGTFVGLYRKEGERFRPGKIFL